ncbi:MAG: NapC/NirT family cytochrome c [Bacillota bacterium]|nr:NapC/NirT family cytochrome c [Bacillota bacterium]
MAKLGFRKGGGHGESHGNKRGLLVLGGLIILVLLFFSLVAASDSSNPDSCAGCHVIEPYYLTWQNSPHANVSCVECHVEPGTGFVSVAAQRLGERLKYSEDMELPLEGTKEISSETCLDCHSNNRVISPSLDLRSHWHADHLGYGTSCVDCHYEVAHAGMRNRETFAYTDEKMDEFRNMDHHDFSLTKTSCLECHDGERVTYNCETCHTETSIPDNHFLADFGYRHGDAVREDVQDCMRCHTGFGKVREIPGDSIAEITRNARFCINCHEGTRPVTHDAFWSVGHKIPGKASRDGCLVCHDWNTPQEGLRAANVITCATCHEAVPDGHDNPRWYFDHKNTVKDKGSFGCFDCHGATSCFDCHTEENVGFGN